MDDFEGTYAPQSPDLSGFQSYEDPDPFPNTYYPPQPQPVQNSYNAPPLLEQHNTNHDAFGFTSQPPQISQNPYQYSSIPSHNGKSKELDPDYMAESTLTSKGGAGAVGRKNKKAKAEEEYCAKPAPGVEEGIEVRTKFPVARIKRIMQADEDVGKVAQVTPTAVSKALELFMISVVTKAAHEARLKSSKRVTAAHLKAAVAKDEQMDFLEQIISKVPDAPGKKEEGDSEEGAEARKKKKKGVASGAAGGKRRKREDEDF